MIKLKLIRSITVLIVTLAIGSLLTQPVYCAEKVTKKDNHWNFLVLIYKNADTPTTKNSFSNEEVDELKRMLNAFPASVKNLSNSRMIIDNIDTIVIDEPIKSISGEMKELTIGPGNDINFDSYLKDKDYQQIVVYAPIPCSEWAGLGGTWYDYNGQHIFYLIINCVLDIDRLPFSVRGGTYDSDTAILIHELLHCVCSNFYSFNDYEECYDVHDGEINGYVDDPRYGWLDWYSDLMTDENLGGKGLKPRAFYVTHFNHKLYREKEKTNEECADKYGVNPIQYISGTSTYSFNENPSNLWDNNVETKFCTNVFPAYSIARTDRAYSLNGIIIKTANDNSFYNGRNPKAWKLYGSNDGKSWNIITVGDDSGMDDLDFSSYLFKFTPSKPYSYFKFEIEAAESGVFQVSDVILLKYDGVIPTDSGQVIGKVLATDIRAYINGAEIPAYNVDGKLEVIVSDLNNYGFKTKYDNGARKTTVTRDKSASTFTSVPSKASGQPIGTALMNVLSSDIIVELDGKQVPAFNVDNRMAIPFSGLKEYGEYKYDNSTRTSRITLK